MSRSTDELIAALRRVEIPTLGHFLEEGFCDQDLRPVNSGPQLVGRARTLDLTEPDAFAVNRALLALAPGDVLVIRVAGRGHAPVGAVTAHAAIAQGAAGIVVDGPVTDQAALRELQDRLPVFATGLTARTTKRSGALSGETDEALDRVVEVAGVSVRPGDLVLGDAQGILILPPDGPGDDVLDAALASDAAEPALVARIASGEPLSAILATGTD
ncbi:RraA family protein [Leucobacter aridicollis]|uniref:Putative 4-hydroxy-4-methyl-2-oxoglutarate aldolase n=1 Tax=Leucobacter aridicollis TaxID=283878 RepID=A0A852RGS4_9MICO|nr:RraA family protein [Leucobacter aridicollis]MBL3680937.1 RraA family protein [Leucobacter aridicollis]NYD28060.1 regulator of RNase E activity RraA [Leucobacter aridicollis]